MTLPVEIIGTSNHDPAKVAVQTHRRGGREIGAVVYTEDLVEYRPRSTPLVNGDFGQAMNQNAAFGGTPVGVHNGGDVVQWTATTEAGSGIDFASTTVAYAGSASVRFNSCPLNTIGQFDKGSDLVYSSYTAITMYVYVNRRWDEGLDEVEVYCWDTGTSAIVGNRVQLTSYLDEANYDVWQRVVIPFADLGVSSNFDAIRVEVTEIELQSPDFFLDNIQVEETGTPIEYRAKSLSGRRYFVRSVRFTFTDAWDLSTSAGDAAALGLSHNRFLGVSALPNGILFRRVNQGKVAFAVPLRDLKDMMAIGFNVVNVMCDETNSLMNVEVYFERPLILYGDTESYFSVTISDNLSGLTDMRCYLRGELEIPHNLSETE